jgi:conjugal transfer pilus assembly protein TraB
LFFDLFISFHLIIHLSYSIIIAGFVGNVATAFSQQGQTTTTSLTSGGVTQSNNLDVGQTLKGGVYAGFASGANKLADFYLKLADQVSPVIEIDARRKVELITTAKTIFKTEEENKENK